MRSTGWIIDQQSNPSDESTTFCDLNQFMSSLCDIELVKTYSQVRNGGIVVLIKLKRMKQGVSMIYTPTRRSESLFQLPKVTCTLFR